MDTIISPSWNTPFAVILFLLAAVFFAGAIIVWLNLAAVDLIGMCFAIGFCLGGLALIELFGKIDHQRQTKEITFQSAAVIWFASVGVSELQQDARVRMVLNFAVAATCLMFAIRAIAGLKKIRVHSR